jgi:hypothetical protein
MSAENRDWRPRASCAGCGLRPIAANLRSWRVIIIRSKGEYLGSVEAPDPERAEAVAIKQFDLDQDQSRRLHVDLKAPVATVLELGDRGEVGR